METAVGRLPPAGQAGHPDRRDRLRDRQDVGRAWSCASGPGRRRPASRSCPTGQTGMMIDGWGVAVDRVISDFLNGTVEWLVEEGERLGDWVIVEGQGSLDHPAYSAGHPRPHPRRDAPRDGHRPPGRARPSTTSTTCRSRSFPIADAAPVHRPPRADRAASWRRRRSWRSPLNTSLYRGRRRGAAGHRARSPRRPACRPTTRSGSGRTGCGRSEARAVDALPWVAAPSGEPVRDEARLGPPARVLRIPYRDPFRIARDSARRRRRDVDRGRRAPLRAPAGPRRPRRGRTRTRTTARRRRRCRSSWTCSSRRSAGRPRRVVAGGRGRVARGDRARRSTARSAATGPPSAPSTSPSTTSPARRPDVPVHRLLGLSADDPADRLHARHRRAGGRRRAGPPGGPLPGPQDQGRRAGRPRHAAGGAGRLRRTDPGRRQHRLDARERGVALLPGARRPRRRADRAAVPGRAATTGSSTSRRRSPLPIVADESAVTIEDLDALVGRRRTASTSSWRSAAASAPAARMLERARELGFRTFLGCMEETCVGIAASAAVASLAEWVDLDGCLLLADDPFEGLELGDDCRWVLTDAPGLGVRGPSVAGTRLGGPRGARGDRAARAGRQGLSRPARSDPVHGLPRRRAAVHRTPVPVDKSVGGFVDNGLPARARARSDCGVAGRPESERRRAGASADEPRPCDRTARTRGDRRPQIVARARTRRGEPRRAREERSSMDACARALDGADPDAVEFVRFCRAPPPRRVAGALRRDVGGREPRPLPRLRLRGPRGAGDRLQPVRHARAWHRSPRRSSRRSGRPPVPIPTDAPGADRSPRRLAARRSPRADRARPGSGGAPSRPRSGARPRRRCRSARGAGSPAACTGGPAAGGCS